MAKKFKLPDPRLKAMINIRVHAKKEASINDFSFRNSLCEFFVFSATGSNGGEATLLSEYQVSERHPILTLCY